MSLKRYCDIYLLNFCSYNIQANEAALNAVNLAQNDFWAFLTLAETYDELFRKYESEESLRSARNAFDRGNNK
jgi:hypothetical protein